MNSELERFVAACVARGESEEEGNSKKATKQYKIIDSIFLKLKETNRLEELQTLYDHEDLYVRLYAASRTLGLPNSGAEEVLTMLSSHRGLLGFNAEMTLSEWRKGNLKR
ncbi:MAG: DUF2019 domain-containing protein [Defluviitaleaceae bacterium]|nr:DUF2019 domain-containing protein [Defluviitaleaceae bacterium]MCL2262733.1 DUF2019 domain-containing protein [Defluviitaleaceae bacterium]